MRFTAAPEPGSMNTWKGEPSALGRAANASRAGTRFGSWSAMSASGAWLSPLMRQLGAD